MVLEGRRWRGLWILLCLFGAVVAFPAVAGEAQLIRGGEFLADPSPALPDDADPRWRPVTLPDIWRHERFTSGTAGWYRFRIDLPDSVPDALWALHFTRLAINAAAYVNRVPVGDGGRFVEPMSFHTVHDLLFAIPAPLLHRGENRIHLYLSGYPGFTLLLPFEVGPLTPLRAVHEHRVLWQNRAAFGLMLLTITAAVFGLTLWRRNRNQTVYLWFGLTAAFWSIFYANLAFVTWPLPGYQRLALLHSAIVWSCAAQLVFVHRFLDQQRPRLERLALWVAVLATAGNFSGSWWMLRYAGTGFDLLAMASIVYCAGFAALSWRRGHGADAALICIGLLLQLLLALNDFLPILLGSDRQYRSTLFVMPFAALVFIYAMAWRLVDRSLAVRRQMEQFNRELEARFTTAKDSLEQAMDQRYELEREQAKLEERERIHRDLHDDLGAKLLTLIHSLDDPANVELARSALAELREVVSLNPEDSVSLRGALSEMKTEAQQRTAAVDRRLEWHYPPDCDAIDVPTGFVFHLARLLREAVRNALSHGNGGVVAIRFQIVDEGLLLQVEDQGPGLEGSRPGHGMRSMTVHAGLLFGELRWMALDGGGTRVEFCAPLPPVTSPAI
ncbi:MAG TPA: 7TM diverse intracellular signaling domain-containing protein [Solimonas sp.]|nr:7TM diverse intracellular signaling domain-containing protein [Solimonas sp.]